MIDDSPDCELSLYGFEWPLNEERSKTMKVRAEGGTGESVLNQ